ncbi:MAG TPA: methyltransferase domain-containing protein, partial [Anaerolineales bacterium]|nr:methyltransferase domain-containing protein [Anaerolineales bacterium]
MNPVTFADPAANAYQQARIAHWNEVARRRNAWQGMGGWYHRRLHEIYRFHVSPNQNILEVGCAEGHLLAALKPARGVGIDFSDEMICQAKKNYPELTFVHADAHDLSVLNEKFDVIILSDLVNDLWDVQRVFDELNRLCTSRTRIILNFYSRLWQVPLSIARGLNLAAPTLFQNWLTRDDIKVLLRLSNLETVRLTQEILWPLPLGGIANRFLVRLWPFSELALSNFVIARALRSTPERADEPTVSVIVPARNESGNIRAIFERVPQMGRKTELVFVEGHSRDDTYAAIEREIDAHPAIPSLLLRQTGIGKA